MIDWVTVPAGAFTFGAAPVADDGMPVTLGPFAIARTLVTNAQYAAFTRATGHRTPAHWEAPDPPDALREHPVTYVDWHDATAFCAWAGARLPTEAAWEKAARGDDGRTFPWGEDPPDDTRAVFDAHATRPVTERPGGASPCGALDLAGNVWEWTASLDRPGERGQRVLRGASFRTVAAGNLRAAFRSRSHPARRRDHIGFRPVRG